MKMDRDTQEVVGRDFEFGGPFWVEMAEEKLSFVKGSKR